jgi:hypothetical protein
MSVINLQTIVSDPKYESIEIKDALLSVVDTLLSDATLSEAEKSSLAGIRGKIAITL